MGDNTLTTIAEPATVEVADGNQFFTALVGDSIPRNASTGAPEDNVHKLGRPNLRWKEAHITDLFLGGALFDPSAVGADTKFAINKGATRTDSGQPDFLRADGTGASAKILAATTDFQITANNISVTLTADLSITSLTVAPSSNNTALVNDTLLAGGNDTKFTGEDFGDPITIDAVGTEISNRIGEYVCLKTPTGEFMFAFVEDATTLSRCFRGFFFNDSGVPVVRGVLSNNNVLTLMSLGWVFLDNNGTTVDVSYTSPIYNGAEPPSPVLDDYWFDLKNRLWKRFDGSSFVQVDRVLIGILVIDGTNCVAARSFDFTKSYDDFIDLELELESVTEVKTQKGYSRLSVYGQAQELYAGAFIWDITTDLETGVSEAASTTYFLYVTEEGIPIISDEKPYDRQSELRGFYHPYHSWRRAGTVFNDSGSNLIRADSNNGGIPIERVVAFAEITGAVSSIIFKDIFRLGKNYILVGVNLESTNDGDALRLVGLSSGITEISAGGSYRFSLHGTDQAGVTFADNEDGSGSNGRFIPTAGIGGAADEGSCFEILFYDPSDSSKPSRLNWKATYEDQTGDANTLTGGGAIGAGPQAMTGIKIIGTAGNFDAGFVYVIEKDAFA
ncbi:MAG: hypothetical protein ACUZ8H_05520 [Candidatus Anammoxibacter sp.]